ncbi:LacI family DNA-binding transcriptional regulator [Mesobacterium pallidum]|uniref:LacI family DNA-binding transcriptional regulator n=1 Tax=Mesobacterium pallidum TaxID=2872037 RepID=UPI00300CD89D
MSDLLGVSQTTVSRALNGYPEVSEATRKRVQEAAKAHGYTPNARALGLATGRAFQVAHVLTTSASDEMVNPIFGDFLAGAGEVYASRGYELLLTVVGAGEEEAAYAKLKRRSAVDAVVVQGPRRGDTRPAVLDQLGLPYAVHGRMPDMDADSYTWVDVDNFGAFQQAARKLLALGHRRIALVNGDEAMAFAEARRDGYRTALTEHGVTPDPALMRSGAMTVAAGLQAVAEMQALQDPPTAYLTASSVTAMGVQRALSQAGLALGRDVSLITFDDALTYLGDGPATAPSFAAMRSSVRAAGHHLAHLLIDRVERPRQPHRNSLMVIDYIDGASIGPAPVAPSRVNA